MILPFLKTLSLAIVAVTSVPPSSSAGEKLMPDMPKASVDLSCGCSSQTEIDRGWEYQLQLFDDRLAAKVMNPPGLPGTILASPFRAPAFDHAAVQPAKGTGKV